MGETLAGGARTRASEALVKIAVIGAGAMGCVFGAAFAQAGFATTLVDVRSDVVDAIRSSGVTVHRDGSSLQVPLDATTDPSTIGTVDLVLFVVKSYHTAQAARSARPLVDTDTVVATMQNGLGNGDILAEVFASAQLVLGVTAESGTTLGPGVVDHPGRAITFVGPYCGDAVDRADACARVLTTAGFDVRSTASIATEVWRKLVMGASTLPAPALLGMSCGELMRHPEMRDLVHETAIEVVRVAQALGYDVDESERLRCIDDVLLAVEDAQGSMVQDIAAGRQTEIDVINGAVVRAAQSVGIDVPVNRALVALVKGWESKRQIGSRADASR